MTQLVFTTLLSTLCLTIIACSASHESSHTYHIINKLGLSLNFQENNYPIVDSRKVASLWVEDLKEYPDVGDQIIKIEILQSDGNPKAIDLSKESDEIIPFLDQNIEHCKESRMSIYWQREEQNMSAIVNPRLCNV